jgi:hypothetical protein
VAQAKAERIAEAPGQFGWQQTDLLTHRSATYESWVGNWLVEMDFTPQQAKRSAASQAGERWKKTSGRQKGLRSRPGLWR